MKGRGLKHFELKNQLNTFLFGQKITVPLIHGSSISLLTVLWQILEYFSEIIHTYISFHTYILSLWVTYTLRLAHTQGPSAI